MCAIVVQILNRIPTTTALIESGFIEGYVTFHAHSDRMKARVLELIAHGHRLHLSFAPLQERNRNGEWLEPELRPYATTVDLAHPATKPRTKEQ